MAKHRRKAHRRARKHRGKRKITAWNRKFGAAAKDCWKQMAAGDIKVSAKSLGSCMKRELK